MTVEPQTDRLGKALIEGGIAVLADILDLSLP
jgi:hypothetical protein